MEDYKSNSHRSREENQEPRKQQKVITGEAHSRKKSGASKIRSALISNNVDSVGNYILMDVMIPAIKKMILDIVCNGANMLLGGSRTRSTNASRVSYRDYYDERNNRRITPNRSNSVYNYDDVIFEDRGDAEDVLDRMRELVDRFDMVSVSDLYDMAGIIPDKYTDNRYGWTDLSDARVVRKLDGYIIQLPSATIL